MNPNTNTTTTTFPVDKLRTLRTPLYYYDTALLQRTLHLLHTQTQRYGYHQHYAIKANANPRILTRIAAAGFGADCVSGGEIQAALNAGFPPSRIVFAGVGKADWEINLALHHHIACFNVESIPELHVINTLAQARNQTATIALRINPDIDAHTHAKITTGRSENKFGINLSQLDETLHALPHLKHLHLTGLHFHIGSQITDLTAFRNLCQHANQLQDQLQQTHNLTLPHLNFGGGLGIDYQHPNQAPLPEFENYFALFHTHLHPRPQQQIHFELGRSVVAQCGALITKVLYIKRSETKQFAILDAGFTDLIRPALYDAHHHPENLTSNEPPETYDLAGPICESSDIFNRNASINRAHRNDLIALRSAGAYGEIMASQYNCRTLPESHLSDELL
jgi:diaminopimelate decarboxylase